VRVYDFYFLLQECVGAGGASIDNRGYTGGQSPIAGIPAVQGAAPSSVNHPKERRVADVIVNVDQAGGDVEPGDVTTFFASETGMSLATAAIF